MRGEPSAAGNWITIDGRHIFITKNGAAGRQEKIPGQPSPSKLSAVQTVHAEEKTRGIPNPTLPKNYLKQHQHEMDVTHFMHILTAQPEEEKKIIPTFNPRSKGLPTSL
jgi:hypothetical protein